jgi:hypothetical protein
MAIGNYDDYDSISAALDQAKASAGSGGRRTTTTSGNQAWRDAQSNFPAVNQVANPKNTQFSTGAPVNTIKQNVASQIPIGGFGLGALQGAGYSRAPQMNIGNFLNPVGEQGPPTLTGYHWYKGTGGLAGGNDANANLTWSNGLRENRLGGVNDFTLGMTRQTPAPIQYTLPGVNADVRALSDPSVGALENARRSMNQYGQNVINPAGGGQIISGSGPSFGSLYGSTQSTNAKGQQVLNTPSGGQAIAGPSLRKPQNIPGGDIWGFGGWMGAGY